MPRIPLLTESTMTPEQRRVHDFVKGRSRDDHVGAPYQLALTPWRSGGPAPRIGQHNTALYRELGLDDKTLARLAMQGVI